jgi:hypothetical protein
LSLPIVFASLPAAGGTVVDCAKATPPNISVAIAAKVIIRLFTGFLLLLFIGG